MLELSQEKKEERKEREHCTCQEQSWNHMEKEQISLVAVSTGYVLDNFFYYSYLLW